MRAPALDPDAVRVVLCDADGCLFASEEPAFDASTLVTNRLLADLGIDVRFTAGELRSRAVGRNFRMTALDLAAEHGVALDAGELQRRVDEERRAVSAHLGRVLKPDARVREPLAALGARHGLALVSSSALTRLDACCQATDLAALLPPEVRYSAEDSLVVPTSKPDPAIYAHAGRDLGVAGAQGVAVEDSVTGAQSAIAAGFPTVGLVLFVAPDERESRAAALLDAGVAAVLSSWWELDALLGGAGGRGPRRDPSGRHRARALSAAAVIPSGKTSAIRRLLSSCSWR